MRADTAVTAIANSKLSSIDPTRFGSDRTFGHQDNVQLAGKSDGNVQLSENAPRISQASGPRMNNAMRMIRAPKDVLATKAFPQLSGLRRGRAADRTVLTAAGAVTRHRPIAWRCGNWPRRK